MLHRVIYRTMVIAAVAIPAAALVPVALIGHDMEDGKLWDSLVIVW
jgi:hypothetical protein